MITEKFCIDCGVSLGRQMNRILRCEACRKKNAREKRAKEQYTRYGLPAPVNMNPYHSQTLDEKIKAANAMGVSYGEYVRIMNF